MSLLHIGGGAKKFGSYISILNTVDISTGQIIICTDDISVLYVADKALSVLKTYIVSTTGVLTPVDSGVSGFETATAMVKTGDRVVGASTSDSNTTPVAILYAGVPADINYIVSNDEGQATSGTLAVIKNNPDWVIMPEYLSLQTFNSLTYASYNTTATSETIYSTSCVACNDDASIAVVLRSELSNGALNVFDASNPISIIFKQRNLDPQFGYAGNIVYANGYFFVSYKKESSTAGAIKVISVNSSTGLATVVKTVYPSNPLFTGTQQMAVKNNVLIAVHIGTNGGYTVWDIENPLNMAELSTISSLNTGAAAFYNNIGFIGNDIVIVGSMYDGVIQVLKLK